MEDLHLLEGMRKRDELSFETLVDKYIQYVTYIARGSSRGYLAEEDIEEVISDVFVAVWEAPPKLGEGYISIKYYLAGIARNKTNSLLRKRKLLTTPLENEVIITYGGPSQEAVHNELADLLEACLAELGEPDREILVRFYYYGEKVREISRKLDISQGTVKSKLSRGRVKLRDNLERRGYYYEDITSSSF